MVSYDNVHQLLTDAGVLGETSYGHSIHDVTYDHGRLIATVYDREQCQVIPIALDSSKANRIRERLGIHGPSLRGVISTIFPWVNAYTTVEMGGIVAMYTNTFFMVGNK